MTIVYGKNVEETNMKRKLMRMLAVLMVSALAIPALPAEYLSAAEVTEETSHAVSNIDESVSSDSFQEFLLTMLGEEDYEAATRASYDDFVLGDGVTGNDESGDDPSSQSGDDPSESGDDPSESGDDPSESGDDPSQSGDDPSESGDDPSESGDDPSESGDDPSEVQLVLSQTSATLEAGQTLELTATLTPEDPQEVYDWSSTNEAVATVSGNGNTAVVTAVADGKTIILVNTEKYALSASCKLTVGEDWGQVEKADLQRYLGKEDVTLADIPSGLWGAVLSDPMYTGKAVTPDVNVYCGNKKLNPNYTGSSAQYALKYSDNVKVGDKTAKVTVTGKNNFSGQVVLPFSIIAAPITYAMIPDVYFTYTGAKRTAKPVVTFYQGTKIVTLKEGTDYELSYPDNAAGAYQEPGDWQVTITGKGNFTNSGTFMMSIGASDAVDISKAKIDGVKSSYPYTDFNWEKRSLPALESTIKVTVGKGSAAKVLTLYNPETHVGDYVLNYQVDEFSGKATVEVIGIGSYAGSAKKSFKLAKIKMSQATASFVTNKAYMYYGPYFQEIPDADVDYKVTCDGKELKYGQDYSVTYSNFQKAGTAKIKITATPGSAYTGSITLSYKVEKRDLSTVANYLYLDWQKDDPSFPYVYGGDKPYAYFNNIEFDGTGGIASGSFYYIPGTDFTVKYSENNAIGTAKVTIKGKGSCTGTVEKTFRITSSEPGNLTATATDIDWKDKKNICNPKVTVRDMNNAALKAGKDYKKDIVYTYVDAEGKTVTIDKNTIIPLLETGTTDPQDTEKRFTTITATITLLNPNYITSNPDGSKNDTITTTFHVTKQDYDISKAKVSIPAITFRPNETILEESDFPDGCVKIGNTSLKYGEDYEVDSSSYTKKGSYKITLHGIGKYSGSKTTTISIVAAK